MSNTLENNHSELNLKGGYTFEDLFSPHKLKELNSGFNDYYLAKNPEEYLEFKEFSNKFGEGYDSIKASSILINAARYVDSFIGELFGISDSLAELKKQTDYEQILLIVKKDFINRRVFKKYKPSDIGNLNFFELDKKVSAVKEVLYPGLNWDSDEEHTTAVMIHELSEFEKDYRNFFESKKTTFELSAEMETKVSAYRSKLLLDSVFQNELAGIQGDDDSRLNYEFLKVVVDILQAWTFIRYYDDEGKKQVRNWILYKFPLDLDYQDLVHNKTADEENPGRIFGNDHSLRKRDGFKLTDTRYNNREVMGEVEYCVFCHERKKDSCSHGIREKDGTVKRNPLGIKLNGCPLDEKISEMHVLKNEGLSVASLAMIMIDNPMCPGTGHRICNDCMKACIYQKQEPVNIPQIETRVLTEVLNLPFGFEIYSLLTRWNPINVKRPYTLPYNGKNVLVVGQGPAGYTLSHFLLNEGFGVVGVDGLKIEPLPVHLTGEGNNGSYSVPKPVRKYSDIEDDLDKRIFLGFGGVSEYGITVRWDKNFLKVVYINLLRREFYRVYDGVRFGGTIEIDDVWELGFDHIAIATGAGKPTIVKIKNNLIRGIKKASDFLMALQLTGAAKNDSIANLQLRLPAIVIGGGLTAIDTATEAAAYYIVQIEKFYERYKTIEEELGDEGYRNMLDDGEKIIAKEFIEHAEEVKKEREDAENENRLPDFVPLIKKWGGVTLAYRKSLQDAPSYRLNHEEVIKSLEEGIYIWDKMNPIEAIPDEYGAIKELVFQRQGKTEDGKWIDLDEKITLPARAVLVAAGTSPNVIYEKEHPGTFELDERGQFFQTYKFDNGEFVKTTGGETGFFTSYRKEGKYITVYGDNHPVYAGNVVKAMASAKDGYKHITSLFENTEIGSKEIFKNLIGKLDENLIATVDCVNILTPTIIEVVVKAPLFAKKFHPGQFFRLQNYESMSKNIGGTTLMMEGLALTGAWVDKEKGLLSLIVLEMWGSSRLCRYLEKGERVVVMGPTGTPTEIPANETVLLAGGGLGNAVLFSIAKALKDNHNKVIYFAGYRNSSDLFKQDEVEMSTDQVVWANDFGEMIKPRRPQDRTITANIVQAMVAYAAGQLETNGTKPMFDLKTVTRIIAIGSDRMMNGVSQARKGVLAPLLDPTHVAIASINSTMQCMMKEVCAQCLQRHVDPETGKETFVFSCFNQDQLMDKVDFNNLNARLKSNGVLEKITKFWLDHVFEEEKVKVRQTADSPSMG